MVRMWLGMRLKVKLEFRMNLSSDDWVIDRRDGYWIQVEDV